MSGIDGLSAVISVHMACPPMCSETNSTMVNEVRVILSRRPPVEEDKASFSSNVQCTPTALSSCLRLGKDCRPCSVYRCVVSGEGETG